MDVFYVINLESRSFLEYLFGDNVLKIIQYLYDLVSD